jgi:hypothetical protein
MRSLQLLYTVGGDLARSRTEAKYYFSRGGVEAGRAHYCTDISLMTVGSRSFYLYSFASYCHSLACALSLAVLSFSRTAWFPLLSDTAWFSSSTVLSI